jgi:hypothetical protein
VDPGRSARRRPLTRLATFREDRDTMAPGTAFPSERKVAFMRLGSGVIDGGSLDNVKAFQQVPETRTGGKRSRFGLHPFDQRGTG